VDVGVWLSRNLLRIEVRDFGKGFNPSLRAPREDAGGWGLDIVDQLADEWGVTSGEGTLVWCHLALTETRAGAADAEPAYSG
jgi:anti-sigma regulatory factor (Ser/Thr protein kinase)